MKAIFAADIHAGPPVGRLGGWSNQRDNYLSWLIPCDALNQIVDYANAHDVEFIVLAGDVFDSGTPHPEVVAMVVAALDKLSPRTRVVIAEGNHDQQHIINGHRSPVEAYLGHHRRVERVVKNFGVQDFDGFRLAMLPWVRIAGMSELEEKQLGVVQAISDMSDEGAHIFTGHMMLDDLTLMRGSEQGMVTSIMETAAPSRALVEGSWSHALIGHVHHRQFFGESDKVNYIGSPYKVTFAEEGQEKGFDVLTFDNDLNVIDREFIPTVGLMELYTITEEGFDERVQQVSDLAKSGDKVRLIVPDTMYDKAWEVSRALRQRGMNVRLNVEQTHTTPAVLQRLGGFDVDTTPQAAMREYAETRGYADSDLERVMGVFSSTMEQVSLT